MPTGFYPREPFQSRFEKQVIPEPNTGCWLWVGTLTSSGYGQISERNRHVVAHRVSYRMFVGELPSNLELDHLCRVRSCVNPRHLEAVSHSENIKRGTGPKNAAKFNLAKTHCPKGHEYSPANTYRHKTSRSCRRCHADCEAERRSLCNG